MLATAGTRNPPPMLAVRRPPDTALARLRLPAYGNRKKVPADDAAPRIGWLHAFLAAVRTLVTANHSAKNPCPQLPCRVAKLSHCDRTSGCSASRPRTPCEFPSPKSNDRSSGTLPPVPRALALLSCKTTHARRLTCALGTVPSYRPKPARRSAALHTRRPLQIFPAAPPLRRRAAWHIRSHLRLPRAPNRPA